MELTNALGATKYWANGHDVSKTSGKATGIFKVSAAWTATGGGYTAPANDVKDSYLNTTFNATLSGQGNVVLLTGDDAASAVAASGTISITFKLTATDVFTAQTGTNYTIDGNDASGYFAVRTNNEAGAELEDANQTRDAQNETKVAGSVAKEDSKYYVYVGGTTNDWVEKTANLHANDKLVIADTTGE